MIKKENQCVQCGLHCLGSACPYKNVTILVCDCCGEEVEELYHYNGQHYCEECLLEEFELVEVEDDE